MHKPKVFLDSSVIITALLSSKGGSFYILNQLKDFFIFQTNEYALAEIQEIFRTKFIKYPNLRNYLFLLLGTVHVVILPNPSKIEITRVQKYISANDSPILAGATISSDYLLTLDNEFFNKHVMDFATQKNLIILKPKEFIQTMRGLS